ncbi:unnamed protein product [Heligmosomoides polygyrus]|uniref:Uncharacterized protein n=1 Tax=Heligmosomoides polygyrus TaxID=6339 RepID=A0A183G542_HELPZ|nr:unnamed protein product [Heligmosomoides polygyrus]
MSVTSSTTVLPSSELQSVPLAVISPAVALSSTMSSHPNPLSTVQPFNSRSTSVEAEPERKQPIVLDSNVRRPIGEEETSRRPSLSCLAVHPLLSLESTPPASSANDESVVAQVGDSAQVTPESSYSVDTFGSGISSNADNCERQRVANSAGTAVHQVVTLTGDNWWDEWERAGGNPDTPIEVHIPIILVFL